MLYNSDISVMEASSGDRKHDIVKEAVTTADTVNDDVPDDWEDREEEEVEDEANDALDNVQMMSPLLRRQEDNASEYFLTSGIC